MSISIPGFSNSAPDYSVPQASSAPKPTTSQQLHDLATSGKSAQQIATALGIPVSQVDTALGIETTTTSATAAVVAAARLSVLA